MTVSIQFAKLAEASRRVGCNGRAAAGGAHSVAGGAHSVAGGAHSVAGGAHSVAGGAHSVAGGAHSVEGVAVQSHELLHGHRPLAGDFGDDLVFAREDAVLIIEENGA